MRRKTFALPALALAATLSACSGQTAGTAGPGGEKAPDVKPLSSISALVAQASGSVDENKTFTFTTEISGGTPAMAGLPPTTCEVDVTRALVSCDGAAQLIATRDAVYVRTPTPDGKPWRKITLESGGMMNNAMGRLGKLRKFTDFSTMLPKGSTITGTAREQVDGTSATRYDVTTDITQAPKPGGELARFGLEVLRKAGITELRSTVWIGREGLPLKFRSTVPPFTVMDRQVPETTTTVTYSGWGEPVTITVPPASRVAEGAPMPKLPELPN